MTKLGNVPGDVRRAAPPVSHAPQARDEALRGLVARGVLSSEQADAVREALHLVAPAAPAAPARIRVPWAEIAGYLGGALVLTGVIVLVATSWERLTDLTKAGMIGVITLLLAVAAVVAAGGTAGLGAARKQPPTPRLRLAGALLALAAGGAAITVGVAFPDDAGASMIAVASAAGLLLAVAGYVLVPTPFGLVASVVLGLVTAVGTVEAITEGNAVNIGLTVAGYGILLAVLALGRVVRHRWLMLGFGAALAVFGSQQPLGDVAWVTYLLTVGIGLAALALYRWSRTWILLVTGIISMTIVIPEMIWDLTNGAIGGAAILLVGGAILLVASWLGLRAHRAAASR